MVAIQLLYDNVLFVSDGKCSKQSPVFENMW